MRSPKSVPLWLELFESVSPSDYGKLSCDLAEAYWNGRVSEHEIVAILRSESELARRSASWAISDWLRRNAASDELLNLAKRTNDKKIKGNAISFVLLGCPHFLYQQL